MQDLFDSILQRERARGEQRSVEAAKNREQAMRHIPEAIEVFEQLKAHGMGPTMKLLQFPVEHQEAA